MKSLNDIDVSDASIKAAIHYLASAVVHCHINQKSKDLAMLALDAIESSPDVDVKHQLHRLTDGSWLVTAAAEVLSKPGEAPLATKDSDDDCDESELRNEEWRIQITGDTYRFKRYINGKLDESYRSVDQAEATVWAAAVIQGYEPPRSLNQSDRPA
ncbi:MAG: hypothetical protein ACRYF5_06170 [Janthinobacterium lividum]